MFNIHHRLTSFAVALIVGIAGLAASRAVAALPGADSALAQIPASSAMVIYLPKVSDADAKIIKYLQATGMDKAMGLQQNAAIFPMLLDEIGIPDGVDPDRSGAFVLPVLQFMGEPGMYFVVPVKDKAKFLANFTSNQPTPPSPNGQTYPDVLMVKPKRGPTSYLKFAGDYAIFGNRASVVEKQAAEDPKTYVTNAGAMGASVMTDADGILYLNMAKIGPLVQPMVNMFLANMQMRVTQNPDAAGPMGGPEMAAATLQAYGFMINTMFSQTRTIVVGINTHDKDATARAAIQFKPDSVLAKTFTGTAAIPQTLGQLPTDRGFLICGAVNNKAINLQPLLDSFKTDVVSKIPADKPGHNMLEMYVHGMEMLQKINEASFLWLAPEKGKIESLMNMIGLYDCADPAAVRAQYLDQTKAVADAMAKSAAGPDKPNMQFTVEPGALTIDEHKTDRILMKINMPDDQRNGNGPRMRRMNPFGNLFEQPLQTLVTNTDKSVVFSIGSQDQFKTALQAALANDSKFLQKEKLAAIRKQLPDTRFAEGYYDMGRYVEFLAGMFMVVMNGNQPNVQTPDLTPVAFALTSDQAGGITLTTIVANDVVTGIHDYTVALQAAMQAPPGTPVRVADPDHNAGAPTEIFTTTDKDFDQQVVNAQYPVIVVFTANYSMDGKKQEKIFQDMMKQYSGDVGFARVDTGNDNRTAEKLKLDALPSTVVYADGKLIATFSGTVSKEKLVETVNPYLK